ncbi:sulfur carrier protein ThiS [Pantoea sp. B65]|uniref:sulfur carrier protein ThiS n=1 Tax=Pantoea sp. B65 TaxID=2813359 RepID=UPI0039B4E18D
MRVLVNDQPLILAAPVTVSALLTQLARHQPGTALAVNQHIVPRDRWPTQLLQEGDELVIFQAIAGG